MNKQNNDIEKLIYSFSKLPGYGPRSARRVVFHLLNNKDTAMVRLAQSINDAANSAKKCEICRNIDTSSPCGLCEDPKRDKRIICIVETIADLWAMERGNMYDGLYHVLGGALSAISDISPETLGLPRLLSRIQKEDISEIVIATNATIDGQTTAFYIMDCLKNIDNLKVTRLASGMPVGGELDYLDEGTLSAAFASRKSFSLVSEEN